MLLVFYNFGMLRDVKLMDVLSPTFQAPFYIFFKNLIIAKCWVFSVTSRWIILHSQIEFMQLYWSILKSIFLPFFCPIHPLLFGYTRFFLGQGDGRTGHYKNLWYWDFNSQFQVFLVAMHLEFYLKITRIHRILILF